MLDDAYRKTGLDTILELKDTGIAACNITDFIIDNNKMDNSEKEEMYESISMTLLVAVSDIYDLDIDGEIKSQIFKKSLMIGITSALITWIILLLIGYFSVEINAFISFATGLLSMQLSKIGASKMAMDSVNNIRVKIGKRNDDNWD
jgi:hypothetical protein